MKMSLEIHFVTSGCLRITFLASRGESYSHDVYHSTLFWSGTVMVRVSCVILFLSCSVIEEDKYAETVKMVDENKITNPKIIINRSGNRIVEAQSNILIKNYHLVYKSNNLLRWKYSHVNFIKYFPKIKLRW